MLNRISLVIDTILIIWFYVRNMIEPLLLRLCWCSSPFVPPILFIKLRALSWWSVFSILMPSQRNINWTTLHFHNVLYNNEYTFDLQLTTIHAILIFWHVSQLLERIYAMLKLRSVHQWHRIGQYDCKFYFKLENKRLSSLNISWVILKWVLSRHPFWASCQHVYICISKSWLLADEAT